MSIQSVKDRINALVRSVTAPAIIRRPTGATTDTAIAQADYSKAGSMWQKNSDRLRTWRELDEMDRDSPLVARCLDVIADCATGYEPTETDSFTWAFKSKKISRAQDILLEASDILQLGMEAHRIVRSFVKFGEAYREIVFDENGTVTRLKNLKSCYVWPNRDEMGNKIPGYEQRMENVRPGKGIQLADWQVLEFLYGSEDGVYGRGLFEPARGTFNRLRKVEDGMVLARIVRSYDRLKHKVPVPQGSQPDRQLALINSYRDTMKKTRVMGSDGMERLRNKPMDVITDLYLPDDGTGKGDVEIMKASNVQLQKIDDVEYLMNYMLIAGRVPRVYLNIGTGNEGALTDSGSGTEDVQFARTLRQVQAIERNGLLELGTLILHMQGQDAKRLGLQVRMPRVNTENFLQESKVRMNDASSAKLFMEVLGPLPPEIVAKEFMHLNDADREALVSSLANTKTEMATEDKPTAKQVAQALVRLKGLIAQSDDFDEKTEMAEVLESVIDTAVFSRLQ